MNLAAWLLVMQTTVVIPPHPHGMHIMAGSSGALVRVAPDLYAGCAPSGQTCTSAMAKPSGTRGVVQPDTPVLHSNKTWYWVKIRWNDGLVGWSSDADPYIVPITPPTMNMGVDFTIAGDYAGPALTSGDCIADGLKIANAALQFTTNTDGTVQGLMKCQWGANTPAGNHIAVIIARNLSSTGQPQTASSSEFQFVIAQSGTTFSGPPATPANPRAIYSVVPVNPTVAGAPQQ